MKVNNKILMAIDFGEQSVFAIDYALYFASRNNSEIILIHVIEENKMFKRLFGISSDDSYKKKVEDAMREIADKARAKSNIPVSYMVAVGKPYEEILSAAMDLQPQFIVMGKTEEPSITQKIMGSNTSHIINESMYPVLSVRGNIKIQEIAQGEMNFVVPLDLTKEAAEQITAAIEYGKLFDARIDLLTVVTGDSAAAEVHILTRMHKAKQVIEEAGLRCTTHTVPLTERTVAETIVHYAADRKAEFIIIMTQQELDVIDYFVGSTANDLLNKSEIPILSVIPWGNADETVFNHFVDPLGVLNISKGPHK